MVASSIFIQPNSANDVNYLVAAYRQVYFVVKADSVVPATQPMYADVFFGPAFQGTYSASSYIYYKTFTAYSLIDDGSGHSLFYFDVQDALQEYIKTMIPVVPPVSFPYQTDAAAPLSNINVQVFFRGSTITGGILIPHAPVPIQGTATTAATNASTAAGAGSNIMVGCNASILPDFGSQYDNFYELYLKQYQVTDIGGFISTARIYSLSDIPPSTYTHPKTASAVPQYAGYDAYLGIVIAQFGVSGSTTRLTRTLAIELETFYADGSLYDGFTLYTGAVTTVGTYYLPIGLRAIAAVAPAINYQALINPANNVSYRIIVSDLAYSPSAPCYVSPLYKPINVNPASVGQLTCLWFQNLHGHFETVTFIRSEEDYTVKSGQSFTPYTQTLLNPNNPLQLGIKRYNTRSNDGITLTALFNEELMGWVKQLLSSPYVMMQEPDNTTQTFRAVVVLDGTFKTKKVLTEQGVKYETSLKIRPAIDTIQLRN